MAETDEEIVLKIQNGDKDLFGVLVERYESKLNRYAKRFLFQKEDVDDLIQDVFLKAYSNIKSFNTNKSFSSWVYRIAHNQFVNALKKRKYEPLFVFDTDILFGSISSNEKADNETLEEEQKKEMEKNLSNLNSKYREILILYYFEELDYKEISDVLRIPTSTVGVRIKRAKDKLKEIYKNHE